MFSDVLLTVDFDRTLTGPDSTIPERNLEAIRFFTANGGAFTMNTGRSTNTFRKYLRTLPVNAPFLLYNGSAWYEKGQLVNCKTIDLDLWETLDQMVELFPDMNLEVQGVRTHYHIHVDDQYGDFYRNVGWGYAVPAHGADLGPFVKFALFGKSRDHTVGDLFVGSEAELARFDEAEKTIKALYPGKVEVYRAAPRIIDVHAVGVSKLQAARQLQAQLGKKILVCVGDAENDLTMLRGADYAYCPSDAVVAKEFENVCPCGEGAVADVIYKKIPEILGFSLDNRP